MRCSYCGIVGMAIRDNSIYADREAEEKVGVWTGEGKRGKECEVWND